ncbi:phosphotransferase enzyme family protein [Xanthocytophaga agilis]|uniref:Phosphotransferase n=1 Tax=Xanthocytophaga agilis TaxID=3048010 RepID=A0AAE3QY96_9BACT|nr:phosphotransferase [Xanthocytophaga agilis]MDJ1500249.1 phosphotransferase [Xanthocytophaga agilis]
MAHFPVSSSILSSNALSPLLQKQYNLSTSATCRLLKAGVNHTYLITDQTNRYIFRIYSLNWRSEQEITEEIRLLQLVQNHNIAVSVALPDVSGQYIQSINAPEGTRLGVMFSFAPGEKCHSLSIDQHYQVGETMARFHQVTHNLTLQRVQYTPQLLLMDPFEELKKFLPTDIPEMQFMKSAQRYLLDQLTTANLQSIRQGVVHMDIWFDNLNIYDDKEITLFDFDFCGNGWLCHDIAYYLLQLHNTEKVETEYQSKTESFLRGYESITPLTTEEKRLLPTLAVCSHFFYLGVQCQRYENWSNVFLNDAYLKRYIQVLVKKYFESNHLG